MKRSTLFRLAGVSHAGLTELGVTLGITHCTTQELADLIAAGTNAGNAYGAARFCKRQAFVQLRQGRAAADLFIEKGRDYLKAIPTLGSVWNGAWSQAGFVDQTLALPTTDEGRQRVLAGIKAYFTAHFGDESAALNLTATAAQSTLATLTSVMATGRNCRIDQRLKREARDAADVALEAKLGVLWTELEAVLAPTDARWLKFIDRVPGDPRVPEPVETVEAEVQPGVIALDWPDAMRASGYKLFKQVVGVDAEPVLVSTLNDSDAELTGVPAGALVRVHVVATNGVGDAPASDVIELQAA